MKALKYIACWLLILLAFAMLAVLVGPFLLAALFIELAQEQGETIVSGGRL